MKPTASPICCGQESTWVTLSVSIAYWYCRECKEEVKAKAEPLPHMWDAKGLYCTVCGTSGLAYWQPNCLGGVPATQPAPAGGYQSPSVAIPAGAGHWALPAGLRPAPVGASPQQLKPQGQQSSNYSTHGWRTQMALGVPLTQCCNCYMTADEYYQNGSPACTPPVPFPNLQTMP